MSSMLKSTLNTRAILPHSFKFVRSDVPARIIPEDIQYLVDHQITTIIDLRTEAEQSSKPCPLAANGCFTYHTMPVTGGNTIPPSVDEVAKSYINMADHQMERIIETIYAAESNVLYFCNAGKDRTGVLSAILLYLAGMSTEYIINDYLESGINLKTMLDTFAESFPHVDINVITPHRRYMQEFLDWLVLQGNKQKIKHHTMKLQPSPFAKIRDGRKTIELRLYDEKRQSIAVGDRITFVNVEQPGDTLSAEVLELFVFDSFDTLYKTLPLTECGYEPEELGKASPADMELYYSKEEQAQFGVVGIKIELLI